MPAPTHQALYAAMESDFQRMSRGSHSPYIPGWAGNITGLHRCVEHLRKMRRLSGLLDGWLAGGGSFTEVAEGFRVVTRFMLSALSYLGGLPVLEQFMPAVYKERRYQKMAENLAIFYIRTCRMKISSVFGRVIRYYIFKAGFLRDLAAVPTRPGEGAEMPVRLRRDLVLASRREGGRSDPKIQAALAFGRGALPLIFFRLRTSMWGDEPTAEWVAYYTGEEVEDVKAHLEILGF